MVLPVDAENEQMSEFHSSFADSELVEVSHMVKREMNYVWKVICEFSKSASVKVVRSFELHLT